MQLEKIQTKKDGKPNGWIMPIFNCHNKFFEGYDVKFIYVSYVSQHSSKGPHLHKKRQCMLVPMVGKVTLITLVAGHYVEKELDADNPSVCYIPTNVGFEIINQQDSGAVLLNFSDHAWTLDDQDSYTVEDWSYKHEIS